MKNVHKIEFPVLRLPQEAQEEDRGLKVCEKPRIALAHPNDTSQDKNDVFGVALICDVLTVELESKTGIMPALGAYIPLPKQPNAQAFVIDWRLNLINYGVDCYKVKVTYEIGGLIGYYYAGAYELMPYSVTASEGTVQIIARYNDLARELGINFTGSGFITGLRVQGFFGDEQINSEHRNLVKTNNVRQKVRNISQPTYNFVTRPLTRCFTRPLKEILLNASDLWMSDCNAFNHEIYKFKNVLLSDTSGIDFEGEEKRLRQISCVFVDVIWKTESKFDQETAQPPNISEIISNVCTGATCEDATVENSDASYTDTVASGGTLVLPDTTINITDQLGNPLDTLTFPVYTPVNIDIDSYIPPCADATYTLEDTTGAPLASGNIPSGGSDTIVAPDATIENSDASYSVTEVSGGTLVLPDSDIEVNGVNEGAIPSVQTVDIQVTDGVSPVTPNDVTVSGNTVTIEVPAGGAAPVGATLMRTGQTTSYRTGDDADTRAEGRATDFFTLASNNPFGNLDRFTDELGGQTYTNDIVIDWSTYDGTNVLGWYRVRNAVNITWNDAIDEALTLSIGGFTSGWRLPNVNEGLSIMNFGITSSLNYSPFNINIGTGRIFISTTNTNNTSQVFSITASSGIGVASKTTVGTGWRYIPCRTFTVTGTTLT